MLEEMKKRIIGAAQKAERDGLCMTGSGNFSMLDRESGQIVITPSGVRREDLKTEDIPIISLSGDIIEEGINGKPSSEYRMHIAAYQCRTDIFSVVHTHSHYATAFAVRGKKIEPVVFEALFYGINTEVAVYGRPGSKDLADSIVEPLKKADVCILKNHGILAVGDTVEQVLLKARYVEDVAKIYFFSLLLGAGEPDVVPQEEFISYKTDSK
jgi:L-ribulose-5-phosphate 4-epimerase